MQIRQGKNIYLHPKNSNMINKKQLIVEKDYKHSKWKSKNCPAAYFLAQFE